MKFRLTLAALCAFVMFALVAAAAQTAEFETIARASGTPEIPGLKMV